MVQVLPVATLCTVRVLAETWICCALLRVLVFAAC